MAANRAGSGESDEHTPGDWGGGGGVSTGWGGGVSTVVGVSTKVLLRGWGGLQRG